MPPFGKPQGRFFHKKARNNTQKTPPRLQAPTKSPRKAKAPSKGGGRVGLDCGGTPRGRVGRDRGG